jgi:protein-disulfide isomerase/uncharacterized membrane protein
MTETIKLNKKLYWTQTILALLGTILSIYLFFQHAQIKFGIQDSDSFCTLGPYADCNAVNSSDFSEFLGVPIAAVGALFYFTLFLLGLISGPKERNFETIQRFFVYVVGTALVIDLFLFGIQIFYVKSFCILCLGTYLITCGHLYTNYLLRKGQFFKLSMSSSNFWSHSQRNLSLVGILLFSISLFFVPYYVKSMSANVAAIEAAKEKLFSEWKTLPKRKIEVKSTDAVFGNKNAKIQIVEFSDFQCPYCKFASRIMGTILNQYKDKVLFIFKNYPLDSSCNSALVYPMHPQACKLARLATCANAKGKFWEFQEYIFSRDFDALTHQNVSNFFTEAEFSECLSDEKSLRLVQQEIEEGNAWDIKGTPAIFINGKAANIPLTIQNIKKLIEMEE